MEDQYNSFMFHHFAVHGGSQFLESKASGKHPLYAAELEKELSSINQQAEAAYKGCLPEALLSKNCDPP